MKTLPDRLREGAAALPEAAGLLREAADHIDALRQRVEEMDAEIETAHLLAAPANAKRLLRSIEELDGEQVGSPTARFDPA